MTFRDTCGDRADADFADQLHADASRRIRVLQIEDELRQIFDRINVVMRRRADESNSRCAVPSRRDDLIDFVAGEFAALAGLCSLSDLDLQLVGVREIPARHTEPAARDLLDRRAFPIAVWLGREAFVVLASFASVALAADAVHRDGQRLVSIRRDRAVAHRTGAEAFDDLGRRLDVFERNRCKAGLDLE